MRPAYLSRVNLSPFFVAADMISAFRVKISRFSVAGGLFDAMEDAGGDMYKVTNDELLQWKGKFAELEGIDIHNAAAVAVASLAAAVKEGTVSREDVIMLNITGGGEELAKSEQNIVYAKPHLVLDPDLPAEEIVKAVKNIQQ